MFSYRSPSSIATLHYDLMSIVWFLFWGMFLVVWSSRVILLYHSLPGWKSWDNGGGGGGWDGVVGLAVVSIAYTGIVHNIL
jgi:hypothetical protein